MTWGEFKAAVDKQLLSRDGDDSLLRYIEFTADYYNEPEVLPVHDDPAYRIDIE